jgi:hypothetical protein
MRDVLENGGAMVRHAKPIDPVELVAAVATLTGRRSE